MYEDRDENGDTSNVPSPTATLQYASDADTNTAEPAGESDPGPRATAISPQFSFGPGAGGALLESVTFVDTPGETDDPDDAAALAQYRAALAANHAKRQRRAANMLAPTDRSNIDIDQRPVTSQPDGVAVATRSGARAESDGRAGQSAAANAEQSDASDDCSPRGVATFLSTIQGVKDPLHGTTRQFLGPFMFPHHRRSTPRLLGFPPGHARRDAGLRG